MVSIVERKASGNGNYLYKAVGLSSDVKPQLTNGSFFEEMDTGNVFRYNEESRGWIGKADKYLASIAVISAPAKTAYLEGDTFASEGLQVQATYTDGSTADVECTLKVNDPLTVDDKTVEISYIENGIIKKVYQDIEVKGHNAADVDTLKFIIANGDHATLDADIELPDMLTFNSQFVLDLNGHKIDSTATKNVVFYSNGGDLTIKGNGSVNAKASLGQAVNGGKITIKGGNYATEDRGFMASGAGARVTMDGGSIIAQEGGLGAFKGAEIEMNGGEVQGLDNFAIWTNGSSGEGGNTITLNGGTLIGNIESAGYEAIGAYIANNDTFNMTGGKIIANGGAGILMRGGNVTIDGGTITALTGPNVPGWIGDKKKKMSASGIIYDWDSNYPGRDGMSLTITGGEINGFDHSIEVLCADAEADIIVDGGKFNPPYPVNEDEEEEHEEVRVLKSIAITAAPKLSYEAGEEMDLTGAVVTATYEDGTTKDVTDECEFVPAEGDILKVEDNRLTVTYTDGEVTKSVWKKLTVAENLDGDVDDDF